MSDEVLTMASTVQCGHMGDIGVDSSAKLSVDGNKVLTQDSVAGKTVSSCQFVQTSTTSKCATVATVTQKFSTKLTVNGKPVLIGLVGTTNPSNSTGTLYAVANQSKLKAT